MDDRHAHFLTMVGDTCIAAGLAGIPIELELTDGKRISGTPFQQMADDAHPSVDETGYASPLFVDGVSTRLEDIVEFAVRTP